MNSRFLAVAMLAACAATQGAEPGAPLPKPSCAPSRACAFELARQAGRRHLSETGDSFAYELGVVRILYLQKQAGDTAGARAGVAELEKIVDGPGGRPRDDMLSGLAREQADIGMIREALATARKIRESAKRDEAYQQIALTLASSGDVNAANDVGRRIAERSTRERVQKDVVGAAIRGGHRDRLPAALSGVEPGLETHEAVNKAIEAGELGRARQAALELSSATERLLTLSMVGQKAKEQHRWDELAATVRAMLKDIPAEPEFMREINYEIAAEWLTQAGAYDEALLVIPRTGADDRDRLLAELVVARAESGDVAGAEALLPRVGFDWRKEAAAGITVGKVLAGKLAVEDALKSLPRDELGTSLTSLGELLPDSRREETRRVLKALADAEERNNGGSERDYSFRDVAALQVRRGFLGDAVQTARRITLGDELLAAFAAVGIEQAKHGALAEARATFREAEDQARKRRFGPEEHAQLAGALAEAGLHDVAFEQVKALSRRPRQEYFFEGEMEPLLAAWMKAGLATRAYQVALLLSERESGNPYYFLIIAENSPP